MSILIHPLSDSDSDSSDERCESENDFDSSLEGSARESKAAIGPTSPSIETPTVAVLESEDLITALRQKCEDLQQQLEAERIASQSANARVIELEQNSSAKDPLSAVTNPTALEAACLLDQLESSSLKAFAALEQLSVHQTVHQSSILSHPSNHGKTMAATDKSGFTKAPVGEVSRPGYWPNHGLRGEIEDAEASAQADAAPEWEISVIRGRAERGRRALEISATIDAEVRRRVALGRERERSRRERARRPGMCAGTGLPAVPHSARSRPPRPQPPANPPRRPARPGGAARESLSDSSATSRSSDSDDYGRRPRTSSSSPSPEARALRLGRGRGDRRNAAAAAAAAETRSVLASLLALVHRKDAAARAAEDRLASAERAAARLQCDLDHLRRPSAAAPPPPAAPRAADAGAGAGRFGFYASRLLPAAAAAAAAAAATAVLCPEEHDDCGVEAAADAAEREAAARDAEVARAAASRGAAAARFQLPVGGGGGGGGGGGVGGGESGVAAAGPWRAARDSESGEVYYYHSATREVRWAPPPPPPLPGGAAAGLDRSAAPAGRPRVELRPAAAAAAAAQFGGGSSSLGAEPAWRFQ